MMGSLWMWFGKTMSSAYSSTTTHTKFSVDKHSESRIPTKYQPCSRCITAQLNELLNRWNDIDRPVQGLLQDRLCIEVDGINQALKSRRAPVDTHAVETSIGN